MRHRLPGTVLVALLALTPLGARADHPSDRTGVDAETITIGLHVPITGAAPVNAAAASAGAKLYWQYLHDDRGILVHGRRVEVLLEDDKYTPSTAVQKCNMLAGASFLLVGFRGTDQIMTCAGYAEDRGIPYVAPGVQEAGLAQRLTYYAVSPSWVRQSPIIAGFISNVLGDGVDTCCSPPVGEPPADDCEPVTVPVLDIPLPIYLCDEPDPEPDPLPDPGPDGEIRVALVRPNTPNFTDAEDALRASLDEAGLALWSYSTVKEGNQAQAEQIAAEMQRDRIDVVVLLSSPIFAGSLTASTAESDYLPRYVMYSMTGGYNEISLRGCEDGSLQRASAFSPWPGWSQVTDGAFDPDFAPAAEKYAPAVNTPEAGDTLLALWGPMKDVHAMLEAAGPDPTRQDFNAMIDAGFSASTGVYPPLAFSADDPFGADAIHRLEVDCHTDMTFHQADAFVTGYPAG